MLIRLIARQFSEPHGFGGRLSTLCMNFLNHQQYRSVLTMISATNQNLHILDIGFGNGYLIRQLLKGKQQTIHGMEVSHTMLEYVEKRQKAAIQEKHLVLSLGNIEDMPYHDDTFDLQYSVNTIYFWKTLDEGLQEMKRVGKKDTLVILSFCDKDWLDKSPIAKYGFQKYDLEPLQKRCEDNDMRVERVSILGKHKAYTMVLRIHK